MATGRIRDLVELGLPGFLVGLIAGAVAGAMASIVGQPAGWAATAAVALAVPLGLAGAGYGLLLATGRVRLGGFAPAALFWLVAFPLARLSQEVLVRLVLTGQPGLPPDTLGFLAYQGIVSAGFAIGFLWLHERIAPRWWLRVSRHNPRAREAFDRYAAHARTMWQAREARRRAKR